MNECKDHDNHDQKIQDDGKWHPCDLMNHKSIVTDQTGTIISKHVL